MMHEFVHAQPHQMMHKMKARHFNNKMCRLDDGAMPLRKGAIC